MRGRFHASAAQPLPHLIGDNLGAGGAAAVAGHHGAALDADGIGIGVDNTLHDGEALVADFLHFGGHLDTVVVTYLRPEVDLIVHHHDGEVALGWRNTMRGKEGILPQVEVLHDDGIVHVTHLVDVVEAYLYRCCVHVFLFLSVQKYKKNPIYHFFRIFAPRNNRLTS